jgi:hypothetical protein
LDLNMIETVQPSGRAAFVTAAILLTVLAAGQAWDLYRLYLIQDRLPLWDMAGNAWGGIELHQALRQGRPLHFLGLLNAQDKWPFGFSLLLLPFLAAGGDGFAAATLLPAALFALIPLLLLWAAREVDPGMGWSGVLAALLFLACPLARLFAVLIMREEAGMFFSLLACCAYLRARRLGRKRDWRLAGLAGLALFLIKYNYALIWGAAAAADSYLRLPPERRAALRRWTGRRLWPCEGSALEKALAVYLWALAAALLLGKNPGYGVYAGLLAATVWAAARWRRDPAGMREGWRRLPPAGRALAATVALPLWIWFLSPSPVHPKEILAFLRNRSVGPPVASLDALLFYPRVFARDYAPTPLLGGLLLALLALALIVPGAVRWTGARRLAGGEPDRVLLLAAGLSFLLPTLHPYKEPRFLATAAPFVLLAAASTASRVARFVAGRSGGAVICAAAALGIVAVSAGADPDARLPREYARYSAAPAFREPLGFIASEARGTSGRLAVLGSFNELSENLIRCRLARTGGPEVARPLPRFRGELAPEARAARVRDWLLREHAGRVAALRPLPASPLLQEGDYRDHNAWQLAAIAALEAGPAARVESRRAFPAAGVEVVVFEVR